LNNSNFIVLHPTKQISSYCAREIDGVKNESKGRIRSKISIKMKLHEKRQKQQQHQQIAREKNIKDK
jgi:hypothetical protein